MLATVWSENFDGTVAGWTSQATNGSNNWTVTTAQSQSPTKSYFAPGPASITTAYLTSPGISVPSDSSSLQFKFWHNYNLESGKDGGRLEFSINGGAWFDVTDSGSGASFAGNGYNSTLSSGGGGPNAPSDFGGRSAWSGNSGGFVETTVNFNDIAKYAGKSLRARWGIATNASTASTGWYVDSVSLLKDSSPPNQPPVVTVAASTSSSETQIDPGPIVFQVIRGTDTNFSVTATDDAGEPDLTYAWSVAGGPAPVVFAINENNTAKTTTANFTAVGDYQIMVTVSDTGGLTATSLVNVRVLPTGTYEVSPDPAIVQIWSTQQFAASLNDQFGAPLASQPSPTNWSVSGGGTINSSGLFNATTIGGPFEITASSGGYSTTASVTVTLASATITLGNLNQTYDGGPKPVSVTTDPPGLAYSITYDGSADVPINAATYAVDASITAPNYTGIGSGSLVVAKASQSITFASLPTVALGDAPFPLGATASSGLAVSYTSSNPSVATVSGDTVTLIGVGSTTITASQAGNANYQAAASVQRSLSVILANPVAYPGGPYKLLVGGTLSLDGSASLPTGGQTIASYEWDLNNDNTFGDVTGATPAAISFSVLTNTWGMLPGSNTIKLRVTDTSGKTSNAATTTVNLVLALTWDANGTTANQTDGAGVWLDPSKWWDGSTNVTWPSGSDAVFGKSGTGGAVTLASPTTVNSLIFNSFTGTYTLGTAGQIDHAQQRHHQERRVSRCHISEPDHPWRCTDLDEQFHRTPQNRQFDPAHERRFSTHHRRHWQYGNRSTECRTPYPLRKRGIGQERHRQTLHRRRQQRGFQRRRDPQQWHAELRRLPRITRHRQSQDHQWDSAISLVYWKNLGSGNRPRARSRSPVGKVASLVVMEPPSTSARSHGVAPRSIPRSLPLITRLQRPERT